MSETKVPNAELAEAGLSLMAQAGVPLERVQTKGRAMIFRTPAQETVRVRTCNDHVLVALADRPTPDASLNIEGTDHLLIVMPATPRTAGEVLAYFVPTEVAVQAVRSTHAEWLAANPNTKGDNRTWNIWFSETGPSKANGFGKKWAQYRLASNGSIVNSRPIATAVPVSMGGAKLGEIIAEAKRKIALVAGVPVSAVKIQIDMP